MTTLRKLQRRPTLKGTKRERTRAQLIQAATDLIAEHGFDQTSLEQVAARAGMTRGAIYGNFKNREDLFLAVVEIRWKPIIPTLRRGASLKEQLRILGKAVVEAAPARRAQAVGAASFQLYALTHAKMRSRVARLNAEIYRRAAEQLKECIAESDLPMRANEFVRVLHALTDGLLFLHFLSPDLITDEVIIAAFESLAGRSRR